MKTVGRILLLCLLPVCVCGYTFQYEDITSEDLGHRRSSDGAVTWAALPAGVYTGYKRDAALRGWEVTVSFSRAVINSIQTNQFPSDVIRRWIQGRDVVKEIEEYEVNIVIACFSGALLITIILICMAVFLRHEYRRRRKDVYLVKKPYMRDKPFSFFVVCSYIGTTLSLIYVICITVVGINLHYGVNVLDETVFAALDDVTTYFNTTKSQYNFVTSETNRWFNEKVIQQDLQKIGHLVWQPGRGAFKTNVDGVFKSLEDLDQRAQNAAQRLEAVYNILNELKTGHGKRLATNFSQLHYDLTFMKGDWRCMGCNGSCSGCVDVVVNDIFYQINFTKLPDITTNVQQLSQLAQKPIGKTMQNPEYYYTTGISDILTSKLAAPASELQDSVDKYSAAVEASAKGLKIPSEEDLYFSNFRETFPAFDRRIGVSDKVRFGFSWVIVFVNFVGCLFIYFALTWTVKGKREARRGGNPNYYPAYLLFIGTIGGCLVLSLLYMCLAMMTFYAGTNLEKVVCQPGKNLQYMTELIDKPDLVAEHPGYIMSSLILGDGNKTMKSADIYRSCQQNSSAFSTFQHNVLMPSLFSVLDLTQAFRSTNSTFDKMYVSLSDVPLLPPSFESWITSFVSPAFFNLTAYENMLRSDVVKADVKAYADNLMVIHKSGTVLSPVKEGILRTAQALYALQGDLDIVTAEKNRALAEFEVYKAEVEHIRDVTRTAVDTLNSFDSQFRTNSASYVKTGVDEYRQAFFSAYAKYVNHTQSWIHNLGRCQPVSDAYDAVVYGFCDRLSDFENAEWLLLGNNSVTLMVLLFLLSVVLYFLPDEDGDETTDEFESVFGNGPPQGFLNKAVYKVKHVFIQRRPSKKRIVKPGSSAGSNGSNIDPLLNKTKESMEMKNLPNGNALQVKTEKSPSSTSDGVASPRAQPTDSTVSLNGSASSPSLDAAENHSGTSGSTSRSKSVLTNQSVDVGSGKNVVVSEIHPRPRGVDLSPNVAPGTIINHTGRRPSTTDPSVLITDLEV